MLTRQKILLHFIAQNSEQVSKLQLTKWAFLLKQIGTSAKLQTFYQFLPYKYGPFSFGLYRELDDLTRNGYIRLSPDNQVILNKDVEVPTIDSLLVNDVKTILSEYGQFEHDYLLKKVYEQFPWFTLNAQNPDLRQARPPKTDNAVYTVGYEKLQIDGFLNLLLERGIKRLIDVRSNPIARRYGFHKSTLTSLCTNVDIEYIHLQEVGIPSKMRKDLDTFDSYQDLFKIYDKSILSKQGITIQKIVDYCKELPSALMCMEQDPAYCHRTVLANHVSEQSHLPIIDLRNNGFKGENKWQSKLEFSLPS